jgi:8-amino-7-oxononanoate synthase
VGVVDQWAAQQLASLEAASLRRGLEVLDGPVGVRVSVDGRALLNFSSNDYLGLANDPGVLRAVQARFGEVGTGAGASRLVVGTQRVHDELETALARFEGVEAALLFSSGWAANVGTVTSLVGAGDVVFSDELNHASVIDGCRLSRAQVEIFRHRDVRHLEALLARHHGARRLVVTESIFSMDGDRAPLVDLVRVAREAGAAIMVDEAHATGVVGPHGQGLCAALGVEVDVRVGTLSKALGGQGAWVAGSALLRDLLINRARSFVFSTGLSPLVCVAGLAALERVQHDDARRAQLHHNIERLARGLATLGFDVRPDSAIFSLVLGDAVRALAVSAALRQRGVLVKAIRPPTVPAGTSRLRVSVSAAHGDAELDCLLEALETCLR